MLHTCLLAIPKGPIIEAILFQCVGYDKFLPEPIVPTGSSEPPMLKDQAVVTSKDRCGPGRTIGVGMPQICSFHSRSAFFAACGMPMHRPPLPDCDGGMILGFH